MREKEGISLCVASQVYLHITHQKAKRPKKVNVSWWIELVVGEQETEPELNKKAFQ